MNYIHKPINLLIYANLWIGFGATAFSLPFYLLEGIKLNFYFLVFVFFSTVFTYTFQRYIKILDASRLHGDRIEWMRSNTVLVKFIMLFSLIGFIYPLFQFNQKALILLAFLGAISLFYVVKMPLFMRKKKLRDIPGLKIFLIAAVWGLSTSILPYFLAEKPPATAPLILFAVNFVYILALCIPFDIRDLDLDEPEKKTIPQLLGKRGAIGVSVFLLLLHYGLQSWCFSTYLPWSIISLALGIFLLLGIKKHRNDFYYSFLIDGLLIVQPLVLWFDLTLKTTI